ncbi:hypothetical protein Desac_2327 [Desulfobacca acetoxidans DSM 11109]|uniref:Uncharacterized protein n=1 Tax=Desulfobacca acetoxidans (strain ATCC 700848 / DSM 11109 / ASRB2) TaxID=880072 RepID=F2NFN2_DESAR|nr:hypothetical protein Desac_2327 [Desulfobacca acetoxidans DSM 11109]
MAAALFNMVDEKKICMKTVGGEQKKHYCEQLLRFCFHVSWCSSEHDDF